MKHILLFVLSLLTINVFGQVGTADTIGIKQIHKRPINLVMREEIALIGTLIETNVKNQYVLELPGPADIYYNDTQGPFKTNQTLVFLDITKVKSGFMPNQAAFRQLIKKQNALTVRGTIDFTNSKIYMRVNNFCCGCGS